MGDTRTTILETARTVLVDEGYDALTFDTIAERMDITDAGIHYHFETKRDLLVGLIDHLTDELVADLDAYDGPPQRRLEAMLQNRFDAAATLVDLSVVPPSYQLLVATSGRDDPIRDGLLEFKERYVDALRETIEEGVERGTFRTPSADRTARTLTAMVEGAEMRAAFGQAPTPIVRATEEYVLDDLYVDETPDLEVSE